MKKKYTGTEWSENRLARFQFGLIIALALAIYGFNYETTPVQYAPTTEAFSEEKIFEQITVHVDKIPTTKTISVDPTNSESVVLEDLLFEEIEAEKISTDISDDSANQPSNANFGGSSSLQLPLPDERNHEIEEYKVEETVHFAEEMPLFKDCVEKYPTYEEQLACTNQSLIRAIQKNLRYPRFARENAQESTVVASFVVDYEGQITDIKIEREQGMGFDKAVLESIDKIPPMMPGRQNNKIVKVRLFVPVKFKLVD